MKCYFSLVSDVTSSTYINASAIHDSDPRRPTYIATQSPLPNTTADFWEKIAKIDCFQIHLVSEHIWSEDYLVRSFYLKNLKTNETRTITQFHYLTWPYQGIPSTTKALLDFRR
uniref:Tyrosine-protein phosphatase domain-containing protein n=1 Tax=Parascaris equorum TaxID=6256 RepID=A0A914RI81_PAREQ